MKKTFFSYSFGCRVNEAEKEEIDRRLIEAGFSLSQQNPALYIINTCAVTSKAEREARQYIYQVKKRYPWSKIVITGCSATYWKKLGIEKKLPVDLVIDNTEKEYLVKILIRRLSDQSPADRARLPARQVGRQGLGRTIQPTSKFLKSGRAMIKIQDGCQRFCSYCIVPYLRGLPKSFLIKDIIKKINSLNNIQEIILTAINTEAFGYDTGETLTQLIDQVIKKTPIPRISFGSIHPWSIDQKFLDCYQKIIKESRLINFFHVPLQSGCDKTLKLMKRGYTAREFSWKIQEIKKINLFAFVATDVIVGFLDESDKDFEVNYRFLEANPIDKLHVFRFSNRVKTASYYMRKRLPEAPYRIKVKRAHALTELGKRKHQRFLQTLADNNYQSQALFIDKFKNGFQQALLNNQVLVWVKTNKSLTGKIKDVQVDKLNVNNLFGKVI